MSNIIEERIIATTPERVFNALTLQDEIARWWTDDLTARPEVGSLAELRFRRGAAVLRLEVTELDADEKVSWIVKQGPTAIWDGTSITWQLTPVHNETKVVFTQDGFGQVDTKETRKGWQYFLDSLKSYLETGKGTPDTYDHSRISTIVQR